MDPYEPYDLAVRTLGTIVYWLAVVAISLALVIGLILFLESRDQSSVERSAAGGAITSPA
jgi:hypothetical protein